MNKRIQLLFITMLFSLTALAESGYVGDYIDFKVPASTDSRHPDIYSASWSLTSGATGSVTLTDNGIYGATVHIDTYFTGSVRVTCRYQLYKQGDLSAGTLNKTTSFDITCNAVNLTPSPSSLSMKIDDTEYITYSSSPSGKFPTVTYSSSNSNVATVDYYGKVTAKAKGYATITLSNSMGPNATVGVSVDGGAGGGDNPGGDNPGTSTTIKDGDWFQDYTEEGQLMWFVAYTNAYTGILCCQVASPNKGVSSCITSTSGKITIPGYAKGLKVTHVNNAAIYNLDGLTELIIPETVQYVSSHICLICNNLTTITCLATTPPSGASELCSGLWKMTLYVPQGCKSKYQSATGWKDFGTIKEIGEEEETKVTGISINPSSSVLNVGETQQLVATITPSNATNKSITWSTNNSSVVSVSASGLVTANSSGTATITCSATDGSGVSATCTITVNSSTKEAYAALSNDGNTVTFYYDTQKASRGGVNINTDSSDNPYGSVTTAFFDASFADYRPTSTASWFYNCSSLTTITGIGYLKTDNVTNMKYMFFHCLNLTSLDLSSFKTDNVTDMSYMFRSCTSLTRLNMNGFKTDNVTDMRYMFYHCYNLTSLDLSSFKTNNVTNMSSMFDSCTGLTSLDLSSFKTDNVTDMSYMFRSCTGLTSLDLSCFKTNNVTSMFSMFNSCTGLQTIYAGDGWSTEKVASGGSMFRECTKLVGGQGTTYDASHTNHTYARIDGGSLAPGYFTRKDMSIEINETNFPDENFRNYLLSKDFGKDKLISKEEIEIITSLSMERENIANLKGIEFFKELEILDCFGNQLKSLDLSGNRSLKYLICNYNKLTTIDLSNNPNIEQIRCDNNMIEGTGLDAMINSLPQNTSYTEHFILLIDNSDNSEANVCTRTQTTTIKAKGWTPYYYNGTDGDKNGWVELEDSKETDVIVINENNIPDTNFRRFLLEQDYGKSGVLLPGKLANVKKIDLSGQEIADLKGIEYFSALEWLQCQNNYLTYLDMSKNMSLKSLWCHNNRLTKLVLPNSSQLITVLCGRNRIAGNAMDDLINSLPTYGLGQERIIAVIDGTNLNDEENVCTNSQVAKIHDRGWTPHYMIFNSISTGSREYKGNEITISTSNTGHATFYSSDFAFSLPDGLSASVITGVNDNRITYSSISGNVVPQSTPVILESNVKQARAYTLTITGNTAYSSGTNLLRGSDEATTTTGNGYHYKLSYGEPGTNLSDVFGWYWGAQNGGVFQIEGHKAWLVVPKSSGTRGYTIDGETTGIEAVVTDEGLDAFYDMQGRRISQPVSKGIYIKNGKKVIIK